MKAVVLIPAYEPTPALVGLVESVLAAAVFESIVVVDDGSSAAAKGIFGDVQRLSPKVEVLQHAVNLGKGAALKTGFNHILLRHPGIGIIVTADADGQHRAGDIARVAQAGLEQPRALVIGARAFTGYVPWRSRVGNVLTRWVFRFFSGLSLSDTQSGLRAVPAALARKMLRVPANGYEFEMEMLMGLGPRAVPVREIPIMTVYEPGNASSHFNPVLDSMRIYYVFLRYTLSSLASFLVDYLLFLLCYRLVSDVYVSTYAARSVSLLVNYRLNRKTVFKSDGKSAASFLGYLTLAALSALASSAVTDSLFRLAGVPIPLAKIGSDTVLYFVNFAIQRELIFRPEDPGAKPA